MTQEWHIAIAQPNCEKTAFAHLNRLRYEAYYPVIPRRRALYGKQTIVYRPMFPRYVFVKLGANQDWYRLETAPGIQISPGLLSLPAGKYATITREEMELVRETANTFNAQIHETNKWGGWKLGDQVAIKVGPFANFLATVDSLDDDERHVGLIAYLLGRQVKIPRVKLDAVVAA